MKTWIVYDSAYGNTEKIAKAMALAITPADGLEILHVGEANPRNVASLDLLIVGSPTQGGRPTPAIQEFLSNIPANALQNIEVTSFDTRFAAQEQGFGLRILMRFIGYAAERIAQRLQEKGGHLATPPAGFIVQGKEGPLKEEELARAAGWASRICSANCSLPVAV